MQANDILKKLLIGVAVVLLALWMAHSAVRPAMLPIGVAGVLLLLFISLTRVDLGAMLATYFVADVMVHFLKRAVFLVMPSLQVYYLVLAVPPLILICIGAIWFANSHNRIMPKGGYFLLLFVMLASVLSLLAYRTEGRVPITFRLMAVKELLAAMLFYIGATISLPQLLRAVRFVFWMVLLSTVYGAWHFVFGPTPVERSWANSMAGRSVGASIVWMSMNFEEQMFRPLSLFANSFQWGFFLNAAPAMLMLQHLGKRAYGGFLQTTFWLCIAGSLFLTLTRTSWLALLATIGFVLLIRFKMIKRASGVAVCLAGILVVALWIFAVLPEQQTDYATNSVGSVSGRYSEAGTLKDRAVTIDVVSEALERHWLVGAGLARTELWVQASRLDAVRMHSSVISLLAGTGIIGGVLFCAFFFSAVSEALRRIGECQDGDSRRRLIWLLASVCGYMVVGYSVGASFMNPYFFFFLGVAVGIRRDSEEQRA